MARSQKQDRRNSREAELRRELEAVLSSDERGQALASAVLSLDEAGCKRLLGQLPRGTAEAPALVGSARAGDQGALFERSVRTFLAGFRAKADAPTASLAALVLDLDHEGTFSRRFPKLAGLFRERVGGRDDSLAQWRRKLLQRWNRPGLLAHVLESVQTNIEAFVPEPVGGNYEDCARWAAAVREFDTRGFSALMARWAVKHRLKRNLWSALRRVGLGELSR